MGSTFLNGANFAIAGSRLLPKYEPFALNIQVMQFLHFKDRSIELVSAGNSYTFLSFSAQILYQSHLILFLSDGWWG